MIYFSKIKNHILNTIDLYQNEEPDEYEKDLLRKEANWFTTHESSKSYNDKNSESIIIILEKEFLILCNVMQESGSIDPYNLSVIQFYAKLDYLNSKVEKNERESN